jgi:hypothetical protein
VLLPKLASVAYVISARFELANPKSKFGVLPITLQDNKKPSTMVIVEGFAFFILLKFTQYPYNHHSSKNVEIVETKIVV